VRRSPARRSLPNLLVPIDVRDGEPTGPSLFALSESRRVARVAGATVFAIVMHDREIEGALVARLGRAGADKVLLCEGAGLGAPPLEATHGPALQAAVERVAPLLVLFPAGGAGPALGPSLAARIGAAYAGAADLEVSEASTPLDDGIGRVFLRRWRANRAGYRRLDPVEIERPVVAILAAGVAPPAIGNEEIDVDVIAAAPKEVALREVASEPDPDSAVPLARVVVLVDPVLGADAVARLAAAAPPEVAVVDRARAADLLAAGAPEILVAVGDVELPIPGTPRGRVAAILVGDGPAPGARAVDVLWRVPSAAAGEALWTEIGRALSAFASKETT
jgi:electron transfer flavoprotein alpha subunit